MKVLTDIPQEVLENPHNYCCYALANQIKGNYTPIPDNATNYDVLKAVFGNTSAFRIKDTMEFEKGFEFWFSKPYKRGKEND